MCVGQVVKGWEQGIVSIKKGKKAIFTIPKASSQVHSLMPTNLLESFNFSFLVEILEARDQIYTFKVPSHSFFCKSKNDSSFKWKQNVGVAWKKLFGSLLGKSKIDGKFILVVALVGSVFTTYKACKT